jgi:hypothetical protein
MKKPALIGIDGVYIPVSNREKSTLGIFDEHPTTPNIASNKKNNKVILRNPTPPNCHLGRKRSPTTPQRIDGYP